MSHDQSNTNPYRKVSTATWSDRKVLNLTPLKPSGQAIFLMLLVGPQTTNIPGVQPVGRMAFAEMLGWEMEDFDQAFEEAYREGLAKADWKARLVFVPNAIKHNLPQSPNVVKSWGAMWSRVPECDLKTEAWNSLHTALLAMGPGFAEAFKSACPLKIQAFNEDFDEASVKPSGKAFEKPSEKPTDNQEAVSSKQERNTPLPPRGGGRRSRADSGSREGAANAKQAEEAEVLQGFDNFWSLYPRKVNRPKAFQAWNRLRPDALLQAAILGAVAVQKKQPDWIKADKQFVPYPASYLNGCMWEGDIQGKVAPAAQVDWVKAAGFEHIAEAQNARCHIGNYREFRNGKRIAEEAHA